MTNNFESMTFEELKTYFLQHREEDEAFYAFVDRAKAEGRVITINPDDPSDKLRQYIEQQLKWKH